MEIIHQNTLFSAYNLGIRNILNLYCQFLNKSVIISKKLLPDRTNNSLY